MTSHETSPDPGGGGDGTSPSSSPPPSSPDAAGPMTLRAAQDEVDRWIRSVGVRYFHELTNLAQLVEEVGEVARILARTRGEQSAKPEEAPGELEDELADVLFVTICLANQSGVDLSDALRRNLQKKTARDARRHRENEKLR